MMVAGLPEELSFVPPIHWVDEATLFLYEARSHNVSCSGAVIRKIASPCSSLFNVVIADRPMSRQINLRCPKHHECTVYR